MSKQDEITRKLEKQLENLMRQYTQRVKANKNKNADGSTTDIFLELNNIWVRDCNLAKRPLQTQQFAMAVQELNRVAIAVDKRMRFDHNLGRFLFWFLVAIVLGCIATFSYGCWWFCANIL